MLIPGGRLSCTSIRRMEARQVAIPRAIARSNKFAEVFCLWSMVDTLIFNHNSKYFYRVNYHYMLDLLVTSISPLCFLEVSSLSIGDLKKEEKARGNLRQCYEK